MPKNHTFRFRLLAPNGNTSQVWRLWAKNCDVYLGARSIAHEYKASFHASGQCHVGLSMRLRQELVANPAWEGQSRLYDTWTRKVEDCVDNAQHLLEVVFAHSFLDCFPVRLTQDTMTLDCPTNTIVAVTIYRLRKVKTTSLAFEDAVKCLHQFQLPDGSNLLVTRQDFKETKEYLDGKSRRLRATLDGTRPPGRTYGERFPGPYDSGVRALLWDGNDVRKQWHELPARDAFSQEMDNMNHREPHSHQRPTIL